MTLSTKVKHVVGSGCKKRPEAVVPVESSSVNLIIPVQGAEGPAEPQATQTEREVSRKTAAVGSVHVAARGSGVALHLGAELCLTDPWQPRPRTRGKPGSHPPCSGPAP